MLFTFKSFVILAVLSKLCEAQDDTTISKQTLNEKVENLMKMSLKKPVLRFNGHKFRDYVKQGPRNYSMIVMLTALAPSRRCIHCKVARDEFTILANSYRFSQTFSNRLFLVMIDFEEGLDVFRFLKMDSAPAFIHFPAKGKRERADIMHINKYGISAAAIATFVHQRTGIRIIVSRPPNYAGNIALIFLAALVAGALYIRGQGLGFLYSKNLWGILAVFFCLFMISGQMWNHIRRAPFNHYNQNGEVSYVNRSNQNQFVVETYIVMVLYFMIAFGMFLLIESRNQRDIDKKRLMVIAGIVFSLTFFSVLLALFRSKFKAYPYRMIFK